MFGWLLPRPECPVAPDVRQWIDARWDWLEREFGPRLPREARLILPSPEFFPDPYRGTETDVRRMLDRVCEYMGVDPEQILLCFYDLEKDRELLAYLHGTAGLYEADGDRFRVWIEVSGLKDPLGLVSTMAHELGHVHLLGQGRVHPDEPDHEPLTDLLTVFFGLGVIAANSVVREENWTTGNVSGWSMRRLGYLNMDEYGYALCLFARSRGEDAPRWSRELRPDVRSAFREACRFLAREKSLAQ